MVETMLILFSLTGFVYCISVVYKAIECVAKSRICQCRCEVASITLDTIPCTAAKKQRYVFKILYTTLNLQTTK